MFFKDKGEFYIVDLHTPVGLQVCVVPDIWCYYLEERLCCVWPQFQPTKQSKNRTQPNKQWGTFYANLRKTFESYNEARAKEIPATENTDFASEPEDLGRGKRIRRVTRPFSPVTANHQDMSSEDEELSATQLLENGLPPAPYLTLPVAQSTSLNDESSPGFYSSLPTNDIESMSKAQEICGQVLTESIPTDSPQSGSDPGEYYSSLRLREQIPRETLAAGRSCVQQLVAPGSSDMVVAGSSGTLRTCTRLPANSPQSGSDAGDNNNSWRLPEQIPRETLAARRPCGPQLVAPGSSDRQMVVAGSSGTAGTCTRLPANSPQSGSDAGDNNNSWRLSEQIPRETLAARRPCGPQLVAPGSSDRLMVVAGLSETAETSTRFVVSQKDFEILRALKQVNATMKEMDRKILAIDKKVDNQTGTIEADDVENFPANFPVCSVTEFINLEELLQEDQSKGRIVSQLVKSCGGQSESDAICRAWIKITSVECRAACNWKGVKRGNHQKHGLELSSVTDAVFNPVFEFETKKLFIRAPEKVRNKTKRSASTHGRPTDDVD
ncbi:Uncharacterized protein APZ42_024968 [Daphnia magna]|uniref:DUF4806 domain-containing protein n=1 Tax=Daphnia magna TaxID=35525 RepID=A0A162DE53_9CRUS|nr:Uncharacterized protein APZ42_024968 [Daphnia magna]